MSIDKREVEVISEFEEFEEWLDKYEYIIDLGKEMEPLAEDLKKENNLIRGCQSQVWLVAEKRGEMIHYQADSDAIITKGLVALMIRVLSDNSPQDIINAKLGFLKEIGLQEHLSPTRSNGLLSMIKQMKMYALALSN